MARRKSASPAAAASPPDQREAKRFTLLLRAGKLVTGAGEFLCLLRDVSSGGIKLRLFHPLPLEGPLALELASGERIDLIPVWQEGDMAGLRFARGPLAPSHLLEESGPFPKRTIRLRLQVPYPVSLQDGDRLLAARLCDLSQHGAALRCEQRLAVGAALDLIGTPDGPLAARVRWRRQDRYGVVFAQSFRLDVLARLAAQLQGLEQDDDQTEMARRVNH